MTYLSPLGYLLGVEGVALLRGIQERTGDRAFVEARIAEVRALLDNADLAAGGVTAVPGAISTGEVYRAWAASYDEPGNGMIDIEEPIVREILDGLPVGVALDAACGTGRHAAYLARLGNRVIGIDESAAMLQRAAERLPEAELRRAGLDRIPLDGNSVDTIVCALALVHVPGLVPVMAEFARVLRPGGHLVISDPHQLLAYVAPTLPRRPGPDGRPSLLTQFARPLSEYLAAALPLGFQVRRCEEPGRASAGVDEGPLSTEMSWDLLRWCPEAATAAHVGVPVVVIWHFQLAQPDPGS